jgi:hypothetical protein
MAILQLVLTLIFYVWLFLMAYLLWKLASGSNAHVHRLQTMLNENAQRSAEAAMKSAEAAHKAAEATGRAVALLEHERHA